MYTIRNFCCISEVCQQGWESYGGIFPSGSLPIILFWLDHTLLLTKTDFTSFLRIYILETLFDLIQGDLEKSSGLPVSPQVSIQSSWLEFFENC